MKISDILHCVLIFVLFGTICAAPTKLDSVVKKHKKRRSCRCKRIYKDLALSIDKKFKALEQRFFMHLPQGDQNVNSSLNLKDINNKMGRLQNDVQITREALKQESQTLMKVREQLQAQKLSMDHLNSNFGLVETVVKNLTQVLDRLGKIQNSSTFPIEDGGSKQDVTSATPDPPNPVTKDSQKSLPLRQYPKSCHDVYKSGGLRFQGEYYILVQPEMSSNPFKVVCKSVGNSGGWTVFQRRQDGTVDFYRNWAEYKMGFGHLSGEFWLGNEFIYQLTNQGMYIIISNRLNYELYLFDCFS
ncbi:hypothetical protein FSP39_001573 [Pinctada imbricata]|uniref:Fibrinogen C-terminal domain-containing protein n=1 Tax=Pinctada imbricata TaxID=66713 RepID=A0AA88XIX2_PINIB|nr:hypothetical protein FSP39_001573 [Pinctada imbricata]